MPAAKAGSAKPGKILEPYEGLPPGWQAIEKEYASGSMAGKTYIRFQTEVHKGVGSVRAAWKLYASDNNLNEDEVVADFERKKKEEKDKAKKQREEQGYMDQAKRDEMVDIFRGKHGKLDGATVCKLPGWKGESKLLACGQICAKYYSPTGQGYPLLVNIEAMFGLRMQNGEEVPDIEAAKASVETDDSGKALNVARRENVLNEFSELNTPSGRKRKFTVTATFSEDDYRETQFLKVVTLRIEGAAEALEAEEVPELNEVLKAAERIARLLGERGFAQDITLVYVTGRRNSRTVNGRRLDLVQGIYYQRPQEYNERPYFQGVFTADNNAELLGCTGMYMWWSSAQKSWKLGPLDDAIAANAINMEDARHPSDLQAPWRLWEPRTAARGEGEGGEEGSGREEEKGAKASAMSQ